MLDHPRKSKAQTPAKNFQTQVHWKAHLLIYASVLRYLYGMSMQYIDSDSISWFSNRSFRYISKIFKLGPVSIVYARRE